MAADTIAPGTPSSLTVCIAAAVPPLPAMHMAIVVQRCGLIQKFTP